MRCVTPDSSSLGIPATRAYLLAHFANGSRASSLVFIRADRLSSSAMQRFARVFRFPATSVWSTAAFVVSVLASTSSATLGSSQVTPRGGTVETRSVWDGVFTDAQAQRGRGFYLEHCAACHGANLQGGEYRALQGERFWIAWLETTVDYLLGKISTTMPHSEDGSLKGTLGMHTYVDVVAHILNANGFPAGASELTQASSAGIQIVKKEGPSELPSGSFAHVVGCLARGSDRNWTLQRSSRPVRVMDGRDADVNASLGDREYTLMFVLTPLDRFVGHRMSVRASLIGDGGTKGLNVTAVTSVSDTCQ